MNTDTIKAQLQAKLDREIRLSDVTDEMSARLSSAVGAPVVVCIAAEGGLFIQCATPGARSEASEILKLARQRLDRMQDLPADVDEPEFPAGLFCAWFRAA